MSFIVCYLLRLRTLCGASAGDRIGAKGFSQITGWKLKRTYLWTAIFETEGEYTRSMHVESLFGW